MHISASDIKVTCVKELHEPDCHETFKTYDLVINGQSICHAFTDSFHEKSGKVDDGTKKYDQFEPLTEKKMLEYAKKLVYLTEKKRIANDPVVSQECDTKIKKFSLPLIATIIKNNKIDYSNTTPSVTNLMGQQVRSY